MKIKKTASFLALFLGGLGIHRFYLGQYGKGVVSILFCWTYVPTGIGIVDFFVFKFMSKEFFDIKYNKEQDLECSACHIALSDSNVSFWGLGDGNGICKDCFKKIRQHSKESGVYSFEEEEVKKIINGEIKNRPLPNQKQEQFFIPDSDLIEDFQLPDEFESIKLNSLAQISYTDAKDQKSERRITIYSINPTYDDDYMINAYCHEREAQRSFRLSRITALTDMETGEVFENPTRYFLERFEDTPIGKISKCFQKLESEILILSFIARADGYLRKKERTIISNFINSYSTEDLNLDLLDAEVRRIYCDSNLFRKCLKELSVQSEEKRQEILKLSTDIINTDKNVDPLELGALELIKKELKLTDPN